MTGATASASAHGFDPRRLGLLDTYGAKLVENGQAGAFALAIKRRGEPVYRNIFGAAQDETLYRWHSLTKPITSFALFALWERGLWQYDMPAADIVPELGRVTVATETGSRAPGGPVLMRHLLGHTAGFGYGLDDRDSYEAHYCAAQVLDFAEPVTTLIERAVAIPLAHDPGTKRRYSIAHDLQGAIVERLTGQPLSTALRTLVLDPSGMSARFAIGADDTSRLMPLHGHDKDGKLAPATGVLAFDPGAVVLESGGGGLVGTLDDALAFGDMILALGAGPAGRVLAPGTIQLATSSFLALTDPLYPPGFSQSAAGFTVLDDPVAAGSAWTAGAIFGEGASGCFVLVDPALDLVVAGMNHIIGWAAGPPPSYALDPLIYQAIIER